MHIWIPQLKALTCAENANHSLHNIQTLRGARTRDARNFARYLDETLERWGDEAQVHYGPHTWPVWGNENVVVVPRVAARHLQVHPRPGAAAGEQGLHPAGGRRGDRAAGGAGPQVVQPRLPRHAAPRRPRGLHQGTGHVGRRPGRRCTRTRRSSRPSGSSTSIGADKILAEGRRAFDAADYRWAVEILHKLVFADPDNQAAREPAGRRLRADGLPDRGSAVARHLPDRRPRTARRRPAGRVRHRQPGHHPGDADRHPVRLRRRPRHRRQGRRRRPAHRLRLHRPRRDLDDVGAARRAQRPTRRVARHPAHRHRAEGGAGRRSAAARRRRAARRRPARSPSTATLRFSKRSAAWSTGSTRRSRSSVRDGGGREFRHRRELPIRRHGRRLRRRAVARPVMPPVDPDRR